MAAHDPDEDARRLSGEALRRGRRDRLVRAPVCRGGGRAGHRAVGSPRAAPAAGRVDRPGPMLAGRRTLVVGSGLGEDAAYLAAQGYRVIAFDISGSAIDAARRRFPTSPVDFRVADLLNPPAEWRHHFDLVVETYTTQALPVRLRPTVVLHVGRFVAPGGILLLLAAARDDGDPVDGPPWPLTRADIESFAVEGLETVSVEEIRDPPGTHRWRAVFTRPRR